MSDRIAVMHEGQLLQVGTAEELYDQPVNRFVADFIGQTNLIDATVIDDDTIRLANDTQVRAPNPYPAGAKVAMSLRPESISIGAIEPRPLARVHGQRRLDAARGPHRGDANLGAV